MRSSSIHILHVDDEEGLLEIAKLFLEDADDSFRVTSVSSPVKALRMLGKGFDCIVSDYQMPGMDGIQLCLEIRKTSNIPFIIYTGRGSEEVAEKAFAAGVDGYLRKEADPSNYRVLAREIKHLVEKRRIEIRVAADLDALTRMHKLSGRLLEEKGLQPLLQEVMDTAVVIVRADKGTLQLLEEDSLRIVAHHGHQQPFLDYFASAENKASACGRAMVSGKRVIVEDVEKSPLFIGTSSLAVLREAGVRAIQSTPMISRNGTLLGILTTQWSLPHSPDEYDLWRIDLLARQAADMIEQAKAEDALRESEERFSKAFEINPNAIVIQRVSDGAVVDVNSSYLRLFEYCKEEVVGHTSAELNINVDFEKRKQILDMLSNEGK